MLHEVLLALSGHSSPLFADDGGQQNELSTLLTTSEKALLQSIGQLATCHRRLQRLLQYIVSQHRSIISRAVATSILETHLASFQKKILDVESKIITKDATMVGAYDIVPLAGVVAEFDDWQRLMAWLWEIASFDTEANRTNGAMLINKLRNEANTGFPDIQTAATQLSQVAEMAWLRQLSSWLLVGKLPSVGADDFFIREDGEMLTCRRELYPVFLSSQTAKSILFTGRSLNQIKFCSQKGQNLDKEMNIETEEQALAKKHLEMLSALSFPIQPAQLSRVVSSIRQSLSENLLKHLLPQETTLQILHYLRQYFLLERGEFAIALIDEAETVLHKRHVNMSRLLQQDRAIQNMTIQDAELNEALSRTWKALARLDEHGEDELLEFAAQHTTLESRTHAASRPSTSDSFIGTELEISPVSFNDVLFPSATHLRANFESPMDLFITSTEVETYSSINSYLLAIRRAQVRLSELWRRTAARRTVPALNKSPTSKQRVKANRKLWATCSAANLLVSEIAAYFEGEIIVKSYAQFEKWVTAKDSTAKTQRDPESLAAGHRSFLASLTYALLLTDVPFTRELRSLLGNVDALIAFFTCQLDLQQKMDEEVESGGISAYTESDDRRTALEADRSRKKVRSDLKSVINRLRQLNRERIGFARYFDVGASQSAGFEPWKGGSVDRLLIKLEFGTITNHELFK
ncbi:hypothetical protein K470DRAFT_244774 [Piedraia hortae CBS 480.64]|uniref:Spindle pole body component n=1 Tax=Piedraia hortae CBS 480.64 TaxID=1314780 RepID=A0A6A7C2M5_9PEZI|nr:hypothetical protein K470DRAFT_244774 [Piedraia hortae CBS 480.64]